MFPWKPNKIKICVKFKTSEGTTAYYGQYVCKVCWNYECVVYKLCSGQTIYLNWGECQQHQCFQNQYRKAKRMRWTKLYRWAISSGWNFWEKCSQWWISFRFHLRNLTMYHVWQQVYLDLLKYGCTLPLFVRAISMTMSANLSISWCGKWVQYNILLNHGFYSSVSLLGTCRNSNTFVSELGVSTTAWKMPMYQIEP